MIRSISSLLLVFSVTITMAQKQHQDDAFRREWHQIDSLADRGLPESAAKIARNVLDAAQRQGDSPNTIKAQLFLMGVAESIHENATIGNIRRIDSIIQLSDGPEKAIWQSINAELYWQYYQGNRWTILSRTPLAGEPPADIATWDASSFVAKASDLYQASIMDSEPLKAVPVTRYAPLLRDGKNTRHLRPTLYDFLAFRAIEFFQNEEKDVTKPAYQFQIDGTLWFEPAHRFATVMVNPRDPEALHFRALHTYQQVLRFHLHDEKPDARIDADLQRLAFVHRYAIHPAKDSLYLQALRKLEGAYPDIPAAAEVTYRILQFRYDNDAADTNALDLQQLKQQLDRLIDRFPGTEGAAHAMQLRYNLASKSLNVQTEEVVLPMENSKALLSYRNIHKVYLRIYRLPARSDTQQRSLGNAEQAKILESNPLKQWESALPGSDDLREHRTELKIDPLPAGNYLLVASAKPEFTTDENLLHATPFQVSALSIVTQNTAEGTGLVALHRKSGMPIRGAQVVLWENNWNAKTRDYEYTQLGQLRTDEDGRAMLTPKGSKTRRISRITLVSHEDTLQTDGYFYPYAYRDDERPDTRKHTFIFTDRAIYRPGQTIYFKGIMVEHQIKQKTNAVSANEKTAVTLYDANGQAVTTLELATNTYGSFSGKFTAPANGLTGQMRIGNTDGNTYISVEEYKRPKFEVVFDTVKAAIALNEQVVVKGRARAYAGNSIDGAEVSYRVVRRSRFPYFWAFYRWGQPQSPEMEITNGAVTTDPEGAFEISFTTIPDQKINPLTLPVFTYTVYADVTDINGETQSSSQGVSAGYRALEIKTDIAQRLDSRKARHLTVHTQNLNGTPIPSVVTVAVAPLRFPGKLYRKRMWKAPDQRLMTEAEFRAAFPDDEYGEEADYMSWPQGEKVWETTLNTSQKTDVTLPAALWESEGWHVVELTTTDPQGNRITEKKYTYAVNPAASARPQAALLVYTDSLSLAPGQRLEMTIKTGFDSTYVLESNTDVNPQFTTFSESRQINRPVTEDDRGGLGFSWLYVHNNRVYTASQHVAVPWSNRDLQLEWATHRDKLLPGAQEEWRLTIKGTKKDAVAAELLAGLYDASLDALKPHRWNWDKLSPTRYLDGYWNTEQGFGQSPGFAWRNTINGQRPTGFDKRYDQLVNYLLPSYRLLDGGIGVRGVYAMAPAMERASSLQVAGKAADTQALEESVVVNYGGDENESDKDESGKDVAAADTPVPIRTNLQETAFFSPQLQTDADGNVTLKFTMPEALTEWKLMAFAHTTDWKTGYLEGRIKTQKDLMVMPNLPRFLRQGDDIRISAKISNISAADLGGAANLQLLDATTLQPLTGFGDGITPKDFAVAAAQSATVEWTLHIPEDHVAPITVRITAKAGNFTDGEENTLPVISNRMLVTETLPLPVRGNESRTFTFANLLNAESNTLRHHALTVEFTGNPAWYAVQALPYLMEYPYECAEQVFNRFYANALAAHIVGQSPKVKAIFDQWAATDTSALLSNLEKNQELKSALLEETPWVMEAKDEGEQKRRIALLFNSHKLAQGLEQNMAKLAEMQLPEGSFPWFRGMTSNRYITQYIATGIARLRHLGVEAAHSETANHLLARAVDYLDRHLKTDYDRLLESKANLENQQVGPIQIQYLYLRSLTNGLAIAKESQTAYRFYNEQAAKYWPKFNPYLKGLAALALSRGNDVKAASEIMASLRETAIQSDEMGMYWKTMPRGYWWHEAPIEAQALLIEAFAEVARDTKAVDDLKVWLLKQKQTQYWNTTKATADAIYALLLQGSDWLINEPAVTITLGPKTIRTADIRTEAGTGYFKKRFDGDAVTANMGNIAVTVDKATNEGVAWGAVYWQSFEDLDKITAAETPLSLGKKLYIERHTDHGPVLEEITETNALQVGNKVIVRIELRVDRDMEYVHLRDMRAACFEPTNVLSGYRYQGGLGYYENTRDVATNFFFDYLRKGTYVFEYPVFVSQVGDFSNGISTIQCMYAPEFSSHSEGIRIQVEQK